MVRTSRMPVLPPDSAIIRPVNFVPRPVKEITATTMPARAQGRATVTARSAATASEATSACSGRRVDERIMPMATVATDASTAAISTGKPVMMR